MLFSLRYSDAGSVDDCEIGLVDLRLANLQSLQHMGGQVEQSKFAINGGSSERVRELLQHPICECKCRMPATLLLKVCKTFWSLPKKGQDALLWSLQCSSSRKTTWKIEGWVVIKWFNSNLWTHTSRPPNVQRELAALPWCGKATACPNKAEMARSWWTQLQSRMLGHH